MEGVDHHINHHGMNMKSRPPPAYPPRGYQYHHSHHPSTRHPIQSVVTTSFSTDEDREDRSGHHGHRQHFHHPDYRMDHGRHFEIRSPPQDSNHNAFELPPPDREQTHYDRDLPPIQEGDMNMRNPPHEVIVSRSMRVPPSPREQPLPLNRSNSEGIPLASSSFQSDGPLKRSFWHHAKSGDEYQNSLPNEFMPPKRSKVAMDGRRDYVVTASRTFSEDMHDSMHSPERNVRSAPRPQPPAGWFNRGMFGETRDDYYHRKSGGGELYSGSWTRSPPYREGGPLYREGGTAPHWSDAPFMPSPRVRYPPGDGGRYDIPSQGHSWSPRWHQEEPRWGGPQIRDDVEAMHFSPEMQQREPYDNFRRPNTFESRSDSEPPMRFINGPPMPTNAAMDFTTPPLSHRIMTPKMNDANFGNNNDISCNRAAENNGPIRLLALPEDRISLSETLCLVREVSVPSFARPIHLFA